MQDRAPNLFDHHQLGPITLSNRVVMAPLTRHRAAAGRVPRELNAIHYAQRASAGLLIAEATSVSMRGYGYLDTPGIVTDEQVAGWKVVTDAVHAKAGRIFLQLWHVGRVSHPSFQPEGELPVSSSAVEFEGRVDTAQGEVDRVTPRALATSEISGVIQEYVRGAELAKEAGFDGVELHGANGYLIEQFLYDKVNRRTDSYGGSIANRCRFLLETLEAVSGVFGPERTGIRLSPNGSSNGVDDSDRPALARYLVKELDKLNPVYVYLIEARDYSRYAPREGVERLLPVYRDRFKGTLIINGGYDYPSATEVVSSGRADLVAFGILMIANPDLVERFKTGSPLNESDRATFYTSGPEGYTDYPFMEPLGV